MYTSGIHNALQELFGGSIAPGRSHPSIVVSVVNRFGCASSSGNRGYPIQNLKVRSVAFDRMRDRDPSMTAIASTRTKSKAELLGEVERVYRLLKAWLIDAKLAPG